MIALTDVSHVIWDFNGTLFDDVSLSVDILRSFCLERGIKPLDIEIYRQYFCHPVIEFYRRAGFDVDEGEFHVLSHDFHDRYLTRLQECRLFDGARELLDFFSAAGLSQSILSALPQDILRSIVASLSLEAYFTDVLGANNRLASGKLDTGRAWMQASRLSPSEILLIGDTTHDAEVAEALGVPCILVAQGFQSRRVVERTGLDVFGSLSELSREIQSALPVVREE